MTNSPTTQRRLMPVDDYAFNDSAASVTPDWYDADQPLRSAVAHLASCSSKFNWVGVYVLNGSTLELGPYIGAPTEHTHIEVGVGVCGTAVARNEDMNVPDVTATDNYLACSLETRAEIVVLIRKGEQIFGQIDIDSDIPNVFTAADEALLNRIAGLLADVLAGC